MITMISKKILLCLAPYKENIFWQLLLRTLEATIFGYIKANNETKTLPVFLVKSKC